MDELIFPLLETKVFICAPGALRKTQQAFHDCFGEASAIVVADENTYTVAGKDVTETLRRHSIRKVDSHIFPGIPLLRPDYSNIEELGNLLMTTEAIPVAVGSGTINDIVKRASHEANRPYMAVPTAASVDGYSSFGASIIQDGFKKTVECPAPVAIVADIDVLRTAPQEMTAAGYADLVGKITAGADWIIADAIGVERIDPRVWNMVQKDLRKWIARPEKLSNGNGRAFRRLTNGLIKVGFGMQALRSSRCASGAEHYFSHVWEMENLQLNDVPVSHGFKVGLGTLAITALMESLFSKSINSLDLDSAWKQRQSWRQRELQIRARFSNPVIIDEVISINRRKYLSGPRLAERLQTIRAKWEEMRDRIETQLFSYTELKRMFIAAGCPVTPEQINLTAEHVRKTFFLAQMIRDRYTVLDLAYELGCLEECVDNLFHSGRYLT